jgi:hypothetical protein
VTIAAGVLDPRSKLVRGCWLVAGQTGQVARKYESAAYVVVILPVANAPFNQLFCWSFPMAKSHLFRTCLELLLQKIKVCPKVLTVKQCSYCNVGRF